MGKQKDLKEIMEEEGGEIRESRTQTPPTDPTTAVDRGPMETMRGMQAAMKIRSVSV